MIFRRRFTFFLIILLFWPVLLHSQNLDKKISFDLKDASFPEIIGIMSQKSGINFSFSPEIFNHSDKLSLTIKKKSIRFILDNVFVPHGFGYQVTENQVVIKSNGGGSGDRKSEKKAVPKFTLNGFLRDSKTGEPLIGANIYDKETFSGTTTNSYGFYSLTLSEGIHRIIASFISYKKKDNIIDLRKDQQFSIDLESLPVEIREVEVFSGNGKNLLEDHGFSLSRQQLAALPGFAGEQDVIRSLQVVPGIQTYGDGSTLFYVRGGNSDQNLILIDDAPIFNPSHMFGFFSVLAPDAVSEVDIRKGDFTANNGGRLSSVIDIKAKNGNLRKFGFSGNIGPYASALSVEGPIVKDKSSFFISGRISTINWLSFMNRTSTDFKQNFYDINAKFNYRLNQKNRIFLTFYYGNDAFDRTTESSIVTYGISWSNLAAIFRWNHTFSPRLFSNTTAYYSKYSYFLYTSGEQKQYWLSSVENAAIKNDFTWYFSPKNTVQTGFEVAFHHSNPGNVNFKFSDDQEVLKEISYYNALEYVFYISDDLKIGKKFAVTAGLRLPLWQDIGPSSVYYFNVNHQVIDTMNVDKFKTFAWYFRPEPRISIRFTPDERSVAKLSYSRNTQFMQVLSTSASPFTSLEVWSFSGPNINPLTSDQISGGYSRTFMKSVYGISAEAWYKWINNNIDYTDHANMFYNPLIEGEIRTGKSWSYGLELMLRKMSGTFTGWVAYTWSRAFIQTPEVNNGKVYPALYDRPHNLCLNLAYNPGRFSFSANWVLFSGAAITTPVGFYNYNGYSVPVYGERNNDRLPVYHRLDLSVSYSLSDKEKRYQHSIILTAYNAYGRDNPFTFSFNRIRSGGDLVVPSDLSGGYQLIPTSLSVAGIIPSINYQFRF